MTAIQKTYNFIPGGSEAIHSGELCVTKKTRKNKNKHKKELDGFAQTTRCNELLVFELMGPQGQQK
jgi:hypothetical protein